MSITAPTVSAIRDEEYERTFLQEAAERAERRYGVWCDGFRLAVRRRLELGQDRYGDSFAGKDLIGEMLEEAWDLAAYAVLEAQQRLADEDDAVRVHHVFEAATHAAAADWHARQARLPRDQVDPR